MNCFCLVATLANSSESEANISEPQGQPQVTDSLRCCDGCARKQPSESRNSQLFTSERETLWLLAANSTNHEGHFSGS